MVAAAFIAGLLGGPPPGWIPHPGPGPEFEGDRVCANHSRRAWGVQRVDDTVRVAPRTEELRQDPLPFPISFQEVLPQPPQPLGAGLKQSWNAAVYAQKYARRTVVPLRDGWLIGFDAGEYGGSLWWYTSPLAPGVKLSSDNVLRLLPTSDESIVLVLVGIAHMGIDEGRLLRLTWRDRSPHLELIADLGTEPQAVQLEPNGAVLLLTNFHLERVEPDGQIQQLCTVDYSSLYPTTMAVLPSGEVYVGMRHFLGSMRPDPKAGCIVKWFVPTDCRRFTGAADDPGGCKCER